MKSKIDVTHQWDGRKRLERRVDELSNSASQRFQRLVDVALADHYISSSEAHMLVQEHNKMQEVSRIALLKILKEHGYENLANRGIRRTQLFTSQEVEEEYEHLMDKVYYSNPQVSNSDAIARTASPREWATFASELAYSDEDVDYVDYGKLIPSGKRTRFFLIVAVPTIVVLLKLAGVF